MHTDPLNIDVNEVINAEPLYISSSLTRLMWIFVLIGIGACTFGLSSYPQDLFWGIFFTNFVFWMGLSIGGVILTVIFQIVRARWSPPVRRIAEANVAFFPFAFSCFCLTYFGREYLFGWARGPMPGREWWMQPDFVYIRIGVLLAILMLALKWFVYKSLRSDVGLLREKAANKALWSGWPFYYIAKNWKGSEKETLEIQRSLSCKAPIIIMLYGVIYSLFAFEMVMGMDNIWYSNMFGGFLFVGNLFIAWAMLAITVTLMRRLDPVYSPMVGNQQYWDLGKLCFGFSMLWAYLFFSQFLPMWYGNVPEETAWIITRLREYPWKGYAWITFTMCFIIPFITLLSRDVKRTPVALSFICCIILVGVWLEKYMIIMPQISPKVVPLGLMEAFTFIGFLGVYALSVIGFLRKYPMVPLSHPLTRGSADW